MSSKSESVEESPFGLDKNHHHSLHHSKQEPNFNSRVFIQDLVRYLLVELNNQLLNKQEQQESFIQQKINDLEKEKINLFENLKAQKQYQEKEIQRLQTILEEEKSLHGLQILDFAVNRLNDVLENFKDDSSAKNIALLDLLKYENLFDEERKILLYCALCQNSDDSNLKEKWSSEAVSSALKLNAASPFGPSLTCMAYYYQLLHTTEKSKISSNLSKFKTVIQTANIGDQNSWILFWNLWNHLKDEEMLSLCLVSFTRWFCDFPNIPAKESYESIALEICFEYVFHQWSSYSACMEDTSSFKYV